jgi:ATP-dependent RNA helicase CshB
MTEHPFQSIGLSRKLTDVVDQLYFKTPTDIQQKAIPEILLGKNIVGHSQTGSGKTHAYLLPLFENLKGNTNHVQIVITAPTRELAMQIHEEVKKLIELAGKSDEWRARLLVGGLDRNRMMKQLTNPPEIIVGTPGRILDMVKSDALSIYKATAFVIDEADLMVELGFMENLDELLVRCKNTIQILAFSATIPNALQVFYRKYLAQPAYIKIDHHTTPEKMIHRLIAIKHQDRAEKILALSKVLQPYIALLFVNSKEAANELGENLRGKGLNVGVLHGGLTSRERTRVVKAILDLKYEYIVATDLASRGIDIKGTSHVINVELPKEIDFYVHRVGRTARAGLSGSAISFYTEEDQALIEQLEKKGITFIYSDIKNDEFVTSKRYNQRNLRKNVTTDLDKEAWKRVKKPNKVKPGYKKKMNQEHERIKRRLKNQKHTKR